MGGYEKMMYNFNTLTSDLVQIHGEVHGFAVRQFSENRYYWSVSFYAFLTNNKQLKVSTSEKERTLGTLSDVKKWIDKVIAEESAKLTKTVLI